MNSRSIGNVSGRIMKVAGIRQKKGDRKGFHIFRHHLATALLGNGIPQPVISRTLGHTSPDSLEAYLSADFLHLKECSISIEQFPVSKEVFYNE
ncbi:tyrosine-type recombinase/integrase [Robertmurraya sp. 2P01SA]|uniref:tyrosine-type recombinase/integrase n=1 Tax=Robertmurraya TaxID=2837507 RepID=UPI0039A5E1F3